MNHFVVALNRALGCPDESLPHDGVTPEPGEWVYEKPKGMGPIRRPEPLPAGSIDASGVKDHVRYEGLGFCIYSLIPHERIADEQLSKLWRKARQAMQEIVEHLEKIK